MKVASCKSCSPAASWIEASLNAVAGRALHTERPFAHLETDAAQSRLAGLPRGERRQAPAAAFDAFNQVRDERLQVYRGVVPALSR